MALGRSRTERDRGLAKDASGAVLPGVTVEASSDALIEKSRSVTTDGSGCTRSSTCVPASTSSRSTLTGFQTFKREALELPSDFTATVDASMKVGSLEEWVTVSGASPVVDVQSNVKAQTLPRALDAIPNAHTIQSVGQLIPGVTLSAPDTGGSQQMQQTYCGARPGRLGNVGDDRRARSRSSAEGDGAIQSYFTTAGSQDGVSDRRRRR